MLVVVAHPDDETFGTGSVIAHAAAGGDEVYVCCATRGELGEDTSGTTNSPDELAAVREGELRAAAAVLGAKEVILFDFGDSGMEGEPPPHALTAVPLATVVHAVKEVIRRVQPDVVVGLDPDSVVDHRDHQRIGEATRRAFHDVADDGARLYFWTLGRSVWRAWQDEMVELGLAEKYVEMEIGRPDDEITTVIDVSDVYEIRKRAIAEHRTQLSPYSSVSPELERTLLCCDHLVRAVPAWDGGTIETKFATSGRRRGGTAPSPR
jgi:LmbE family N-acetylglucosaminyl deacetylase